MSVNHTPSLRAKEPRILAVANQKGGVGKTTTAINLGTGLAAVGEKVLIIDLDPQGNASTGLGIPRSAREVSTYEIVIDEAPLETAILETEIPNLSIVPSTVDLAGAELELINVPRRSYRLRDALNQYFNNLPQNCVDFDYVLIDCPPSLNLLTVNAMVASDSVLVPLQAEFFALEGLSQLMLSIREVRQTANRDLRIEGVVLTMFDTRNNLSRQVELDVRENLGDLVYQTIVPRNVRLSEAPSFAMPALLYDHTSKGSIAYQKLAAEMLRRHGEKSAKVLIDE